MAFEKVEIFEFEPQSEEFEKAYFDLLDRLRQHALSQILPPENAHGYSHGRQWQTVTSSEPDEVSHLKIHEHQAQIKFDDILEHRLSVIFDFTQGIVSSFSDGYMQTMYQAVSEACEKSGNIVRSNEIGSPALSFLQALKNIQFGVDRAGKISRPEFHLGTDAFKKLEEDAERLGNKFKEEVERVTKEKEEEALAREAERLSRFKGS